MATTSRLNRTLTDSFRIYANPYYSGSTFGYGSGESVNGSNGLFSKFINVSVRNADGTFEFPLCAAKTFYEALADFIKAGHNLANGNETCKVLAPIHCNNTDVPYRASAIDSAYMDGFYSQIPFGVSKVEIGPSNRRSEVKATYYQAPGLILDELFRPLIYLTIVGKYTGNGVEYTELRVRVAHRIFNQDDSISKFLLKKVVPFYLFNTVNSYVFSPTRDSGMTRGWSINSDRRVNAKVELDPLDNLILSVKTPQNYEEMENNIYAQLSSEDAVKEMFNPERMFQ